MAAIQCRCRATSGCLAPVLCGERPLTPAERDRLKAHAEACAGQQAIDARLGAGAGPVVNPYPRGTRRNVFWTSYFLEEQLRLEIVAEESLA